MTAVEKEDEGAKRTTGVVKFGLGAYRQVAAVLGAFSLAALISNFVHIGWRGFFVALVGAWDAYVQPPVKWAFDSLISTPLR